MLQDRRSFLAAESRGLAAEHLRNVVAAHPNEIVGGHDRLQLRHDEDQVVFAQEALPRPDQRRLHTLDGSSAQLLCSLLKIGIFNERLSVGHEAAPIAGQRSRKGDRNHPVVVDAKPDLPLIEARCRDDAAIERHRRPLVLHIGRGRRLWRQTRLRHRLANQGGDCPHVNGFRDIEKIDANGAAERDARADAARRQHGDFRHGGAQTPPQLQSSARGMTRVRDNKLSIGAVSNEDRRCQRQRESRKSPGPLVLRDSARLSDKAFTSRRSVLT